MLDACGLFAQVLRVLCSQNIHLNFCWSAKLLNVSAQCQCLVTCWARAAPCDTMVATYDATKWPSVLIRATMNVVQQRMHLRHVMKGVRTISARFVDSDSELLNVSVCWHAGPRATSCDTMVAKYDATKWPSVLISTTINVVQQRMHLRHAMKSAWSTFGLDVNKIGVLVTSADTHDLVLPLATLWWQNMMQYSGHTCWSTPKWMLCNNECT